MGDNKGAFLGYEQCVSMYQSSENVTDQSRGIACAALGQLGWLCFDQGDFALARVSFERALELEVEEEDRKVIQRNIGFVREKEGEMMSIARIPAPAPEQCASSSTLEASVRLKEQSHDAQDRKERGSSSLLSVGAAVAVGAAAVGTIFFLLRKKH